VQRNYAHDTQGYCVAVFAAGYTTSESIVRDNLCVDNGLSPRLAALQGAVYLHTWNDGPIKGLQFEGNTIQWNPPVPDAAAIVNDALIPGMPVAFQHNRVVSSALHIYRSNAQLSPSANTYNVDGEALFTFGDLHDVTLSALQAAGKESESSLAHRPLSAAADSSLRIEAYVDLALDSDGLLAPDARAQLVVLRNMAGQYGSDRVKVCVHLRSKDPADLEANALRDLEDVYPGALHYDHATSTNNLGTVRLLTPAGSAVHEWQGFQNAATLGAAVRARLGAPQYAHAQPPSALKGKE
jgi:hypothetical protein